MSLSFSDTSTYRGLVQVYEKEIGADYGDVSGSTERLKGFTADANLSLDDFFTLAFRVDGTWQGDDSGHTDYPIITANLVSGQRDYPFTTDEQGNLILDIYKVMVADANGNFNEITPVDVQTERETGTFYDGQNASGVPSRYDKTANALFLDPVPNYNATGGLKMYINREPSYFTYTDTTKKAGIPSLYHHYLALKPALSYARRNNLAQFPALQIAVAQLERDILEYYSFRDAHNRKRFTVSANNR